MGRRIATPRQGEEAFRPFCEGAGRARDWFRVLGLLLDQLGGALEARSCEAANLASERHAMEAAELGTFTLAGNYHLAPAALAEQCRILRDIIGNPFHPLEVDPCWRTPTVTALAEAIYQERVFDRLPFLADALEDAGCEQAYLLRHCRQPGEHVRGCWVVDLMTGRK